MAAAARTRSTAPTTATSGSLIYANQPYAAHAGCDTGERPNGDDADATINVTSHEHREAINDPLLNAWWDTDTGEEGSDKCAWDFGSPINGPSGAHYNQTINGHNYYLQQEWSNDPAAHGCLLLYGGGPPPPPPSPPPPPNGPTVSSFQPSSGPVNTIVTVNGTKLHGCHGREVQRQAGVAVARPDVDEALGTRGDRLDHRPDLRDDECRHGCERVELHGDGRLTATPSTSTSTSASPPPPPPPPPPGTPTISSFTPTSGPVMTIVTINGTNFTGVTAVKFNGKLASPWIVQSSTKLVARVAAGSTTGKITVTNGSGTGTSTGNFTVT